MNNKIVKYAALVGKVAISLVLLRFAFSDIALGEAIDGISLLPWSIAALALIILLLQFFVASLRQNQVLSMLSTKIDYGESFKIILICSFFSQTFISFFGGDAMRIWHLNQMGLQIRAVARAIFLDRVIGFVGVVLLIVLVLPGTLRLIHEPAASWSLIALAITGIAGTLVFLLLGVIPENMYKLWNIGPLKDLVEISQKMVSEPFCSVGIFFYSLIMQLLNVLAMYTLAHGFEVSITLVQCLMLVPPVLFMSMLPISFAGWGIREGAMVVAFGFLGIPAGKAILVSMSFGLVLLSVSLLGGPIWLLNRRRPRELEKNGGI